MKIAFGISTLALGLALLAAPASAQQHHWPSPSGNSHSSSGWTHNSGWHGNAGWHGAAGWHGGWHAGPRPGFRAHVFVGHDFAHFGVADRHAWVGGHWWHGPWHGRRGWWWFAGGSWYFYNAPIYPYPLYVSDYYVDDNYYDYPDDDAAPGAGYSWYYCQNPPGYYPYVRNCSTQWQQVPAGAPPGYQSGANEQGPPPGYHDNDDADAQDGPPPGYAQGPNGNPPPPPNGH